MLDHAVNAAVLISYICNRMEDKFGVVSFSAAAENGVAFGRGGRASMSMASATESGNKREPQPVSASGRRYAVKDFQ